MDWIEKYQFKNVLEVFFYENKAIYYSTKNNYIFGVNLSDGKTFFSISFDQKIEKFQITKTKLAVMFESIIQIYDLKSQNLLYEKNNSKINLISSSFNNDYFLFNNEDHKYNSLFTSKNDEIKVIINQNIDTKKILRNANQNRDRYILFNNFQIFDNFDNMIIDNPNLIIINNQIFDKFKYNKNQKLKTLSSLEDHKVLNIYLREDSNEYHYNSKDDIFYMIIDKMIFTIIRDKDINEEDSEEYESTFEKFYHVSNIYVVNKNESISSMSSNTKWFITTENNTVKIYHYEKKPDTLIEQYGKMYILQNIHGGDLTIIDSNNREESYNKYIIFNLFGVIKNLSQDLDSNIVELDNITIDELDKLIREIILDQNITDKELYDYFK